MGHHTPLTADPRMIGVIVAALIALVAVILWLIHRGTIASDGLTPLERKALAYEEREILSMLRQNGGPMAQKDIVDGLPGDFQDLAMVMKGMEDKGLIHREWDAEKGTYVVTAHD